MLSDGTGNVYIHCLVGGPHDGTEIPAGVPYIELKHGGAVYIPDEVDDAGKAVTGTIEPRSMFGMLRCDQPFDPDAHHFPPHVGVRMVFDRYEKPAVKVEKDPGE